MIHFTAAYDKPSKGRQLLEAWNLTELVERTRHGTTTPTNAANRGASGVTIIEHDAHWCTRNALRFTTIDDSLTTTHLNSGEHPGHSQEEKAQICSIF
jgi:hypothetical protein